MKGVAVGRGGNGELELLPRIINNQDVRFFLYDPEGKVVKNRLHLDVRVGTGLVGEQRLAALEAECARLIPLGAERVRLLLADDESESCLVMQDV